MKTVCFANVSKRYRVGPGSYGTLRDEVAALFPKVVSRQPKEASPASINRDIWALKDVSFEVEPGQAFGIIGPNGAGKSTILKLLGGITAPTQGHIHVDGRIAPLIELGAGFHPELTGRENVYINGVILGMSREEVRRKFDDIVAFAELEEFLDVSLKKYSSGMYARLGFSVAIHTEPDVLLVDEVLAVGDFAFQEKCLARIEVLKKQGVGVVFVSHNLDMVRRVCDQAILLEHGRISVKGKASEVTSQYFQAVVTSRIEIKSNDQGYAQIKDVRLLDVNQVHRTSFRPGEKVYLCYKVHVCQCTDSIEVGFVVMRSDGLQIVSAPGSAIGGTVLKPLDSYVYEVTFQLELNLLGGTYLIQAWVTDKSFARVFDWVVDGATITVADDYSHGGVADLKPVCTIIELKPSS